MFQRIELKGLKNSERFGYAAEVPFFKGIRKVDFKPGLNVLFGPNGSGKSTLLRMLGDTMVATQGGITAITEASIHDTVNFNIGKRRTEGMKDKIGLSVIHDGQPVIFCDPRKAVGLDGGAFDDDFFAEGIAEVTTRRGLSHGQVSQSRMQAALAVLAGKARPKPEIIEVMKKDHVNDVWGSAIDLVKARLEPRCEKGQFTVLLDEPEANFSLQWQAKLWELIASPAVAERCQVIVASHSPFVLGIKHANYIDMVPNYSGDMLALLSKHFASRQAA